jgi:hypothetical protein
MRIRIGCLCGWLALGIALPASAAEPVNACGCYRDDSGACKCGRKSKCGCPEECEPIGCEEKRQKEADKAADKALKEIAAKERKKAAEAGKAKAKAKVNARLEEKEKVKVIDPP